MSMSKTEEKNMKYDFDLPTQRRNTNQIKWDCKEGELPMWIADMDFKTSLPIQKALKKKVEEGIYGYTYPYEGFFKAYQDFYLERHHLKLERSWMMFSTGVVPTISSCVRKLTKVGDNIVVLSPVYNIFYNSIVNNQRNILQVPLLYEDGKYSIDFPALEKAFQKEETTMMILCNPANPVSKIWTKEELAKIGKLAKDHHVVVLSDEIHAEIVRPGKEYVPFISASEDCMENCVMAISVTKCFNLAGIQTSLVVVPNPELRRKINRQINTDEVAEPNVFACVASEAALNDSRDFLDQLREYLFANRDYASDYLFKNVPEVKLVNGDATYLLWIDVSHLSSDSEEFTRYLREKTGLIVNDGAEYGGNGNLFIRMNVACQREKVKDGLSRLKRGVDLYKQEKGV